MKKTIVSGITATGKLTLGNYLGVIKQLVKLQEEFNMYIFVADLHAITTYIKPEILKQNKEDIFALYLACGLDIEKTTIFFQSDISEHSELNWIITTQTTMGELSRMTQFKDKSQKEIKQSNGTETIPTGLFVYPTLMTSDIILYNPDYVLVGIDQKQHLELCKKIIQRINKKYKLKIKIPQLMISEISQKIYSLQNPEQKMSKSDSNENASIYLLDDPEIAYKKIQKSITDSENKIYLSDNKPGVKNLLIIFASLKDITLKEAENYFIHKNYKELKEEVGLLVKTFLFDIQKKYSEYKKCVNEYSIKGANKALNVAKNNYLTIKKAFGIN